MDFQGRYSIPAPPDAVLAALRDPAVLAACIPGAERVEKRSDTEYVAAAMVKVGPVRARFEGRVTLVPEPPPPGAAHALLLSGEGQGGAAGFARGQSRVSLAPDAGGTLLQYDAKATIGGRLAQLGQRLIDAAAKSLADQFFAKFAERMGPAAPAQQTPAETVSAPAARAEEGLAPQIWVVGVIAIVVILLIVFSAVL
jgi:carbon monoxide dehydrogenase subunit G